MLTLRDCLDMCDLTPEVVDAIAERERLPAILAAQLGCCLSCTPDGCRQIDHLLRESIATAARQRDFRRCASLQSALDQFRAAHPTGRA